MQRMIRSIFVLFSLGFFTVATAGFPPRPQWGDYLNLAKELYGKDYEGTLRVLKKLEALKKERGFVLTKEALELLREVEGYIKARRSADGNETPADSEDVFDNEIIKTEGTCEGLPVGSSCWMELINRPKCYVWNENLREGEIMAWSGQCFDGFAQGRGTLKTVAVFLGDVFTNKGEEKGYLRDGKRHGKWVERFSNGRVTIEGSFVDDEKHGDWVYYYSDGTLKSKGTYVNGKKHGDWVERDKDLGTQEGLYVNDKKHGEWINSWSNGRSKGRYVNGEKEGTWLTYKDEKCWSEIYDKGGTSSSRKKLEKEERCREAGLIP